MSEYIYIRTDKWYSIEVKYVYKLTHKDTYVHILFVPNFKPTIPGTRKHDHRFCIKIYDPEENFRNEYIQAADSSDSTSSSSISSESVSEDDQKQLYPGIIFKDSLISRKVSVKKSAYTQTRDTEILRKYKFVDGLPIKK